MIFLGTSTNFLSQNFIHRAKVLRFLFRIYQMQFQLSFCPAENLFNQNCADWFVNHVFNFLFTTFETYNIFMKKINVHINPVCTGAQICPPLQEFLNFLILL